MKYIVAGTSLKRILEGFLLFILISLYPVIVLLELKLPMYFLYIFAIISAIGAYLGSRHYEGCRNLYETLLWGVSASNKRKDYKLHSIVIKVILYIERALQIYAFTALPLVIASLIFLYYGASIIDLQSISNVVFYLNMGLSIMYITGSITGHLARAKLYLKYYTKHM